MNTLTNTKLVGVECSFHFSNAVTGDDLARIERQVQRTIEGLEYSANSMFFISHKEVRAVIGIEIDGFNPYKSYDELRKPLQRLIDSHKEEATYGFSN